MRVTLPPRTSPPPMLVHGGSGALHIRMEFWHPTPCLSRTGSGDTLSRYGWSFAAPRPAMDGDDVPFWTATHPSTAGPPDRTPSSSPSRPGRVLG